MPKWNEEMVSHFIIHTCQLLPRWRAHASDHMHNLIMTEIHSPNEYGIVCGSTAEFFIRPLNTCIGDFDYLTCRTNELAFCGDSPVLPEDISGLADMIKCYEIESYDEFPGFVRLRESSELKYNWKSKEYTFIRYIYTSAFIYLCLSRNISENRVFENKFYCKANESYLKCVDCGPALKFPADESTTNVDRDSVRCIFCPQWPKEARHWPTRPRTFGWPTMNTITEVVQSGCHIVYVQHRSCRNDDIQWRFSFSLAEVILLQSWTKTQQIVYHLLRFFSKRELFQKDCPKEDEVLCTYHLKTLMLWTCEGMSPEWWNSSPVIALCSEMLEILSKWLKRRFYPNYFIPEANLFHKPSRTAVLHQTQRRLNDFSIPDILSHWFVENYILPITRTQLKCLNKGNVITNFMGYLLPLLEHRKAAVSDYLNDRFLSIMKGSNYCRRAIKCGCNSGLRFQLQLKQFDRHISARKLFLPIIDKVLCFKYYEILLYILHTEDGMRCGELSWDSSLFVELVNSILTQPNIIRSQHHNFPKTYTEQSSRFQFLSAQNLMENLSGLNSSAEFQLLSLMSKEFLRRTLEYDDSQLNGIAPAALTYLAAIHFATSEYPEAIRLCISVLSDETPRKDKDKETLNAGCLLFIDDIASIVGLFVLHKTITNIDIQHIGGKFSHDLRLSCGVFAHYLIVQSEDRITKSFKFYNDLPDPEFPVEEYLMVLIKMKSGFTMKSGIHFNAVYRRTNYLTETEATSTNRSIIKGTVIDLLMKIAIGNMTSFYSVFLKDFGVECNIVDCYRALYFYKCRHYDEALQLCERILNEPDLEPDVKDCLFTYVFVTPPFDSFFDGEVQSLLAFLSIFEHLSPLNDDLHKCDAHVSNDSTFRPMYRFHYMSEKYNKKCLSCRYSGYGLRFIGRHFVARYLKVRCRIDCYLSYREALTEFAAQKIYTTLERLICVFILRRHRIIKHLGIAKDKLRV